MWIKELHISLINNILEVIKRLIYNHRMHNLYTIFVKILEINKRFANNLVNEKGKKD
jgi:hypothetical protein